MTLNYSSNMQSLHKHQNAVLLIKKSLDQTTILVANH